MSNELEKKFFETFEIEPVCLMKEMRKPVCYDTTKCERCNWYEYPLITDHVLLEIIKLLLDCEVDIHHDCIKSENFKEDILSLAIQQLGIIFPYYKDSVRKIMEWNG